MAKARVLAVDDQRYFRELVEGLLGEEGFEVQTASSGEEALRVLEQSRFDVVVTDLVMPGMDGSELVHRIKERDEDQEIVVVTGVVDVKTAVEAMKLGATDYLLKPFDRSSLVGCLESILEQRRLKAEHARLLAENIEYMGERALFERALKLFTRLSVPPLAEAIVEGLCVETQAQRGVLWTASPGGQELELAAARGLVRVEQEPQTLVIADLPGTLSSGPGRVERLGVQGTEADGVELQVALRDEGRLIGVARLGDKLGGERFDAVDAGCADRFAGFAETALVNALRFRTLTRRSLKDPVTGAYIYPYFEDVTRNEIEKASRFGRSFSILILDAGDLEPVRREYGDERLDGWLAGLAGQVRAMLRATDLLAIDPRGRLWALLSEADALGAARLKERARESLQRSELLAVLDPAQARPEAVTATYPGDGSQLEGLVRTLERRLEEARSSRTRIGELERMSFADGLEALLRQGRPVPSEAAGQIARFVLDEVARRPDERRLLFMAPGRILAHRLAEGLAGLKGVPTRAEIAVVAEGERPESADADVAWISPRRLDGVPPFLILYGEGAPYALVRSEDPEGPMYHTHDRSLVEHLALRLRRELAVRHPFDAASGGSPG